MKYLIEHRYKVINSLTVHICALLFICERGRSQELEPRVRLMADLLGPLDTMQSAPFKEPEILLVKELRSGIEELLHLPEDISEKGRKLLHTCKLLSKAIDPFHFKEDDSPGIRKSQVVEFTKELQLYLKALKLELEGKSSPIMDKQSIIKDVMTDIARISVSAFTEKEMSALNELFHTHQVYISQVTLEVVKTFLEKASAVEKIFKK